MALWNLIPTCDDAMSCYTLIAFIIVVSMNITAFGLMIRWNLREYSKVSAELKGHDMYIDATTNVINKIRIELAVQESSMETLKNDIAEIKTDVKTLLKR